MLIDTHCHLNFKVFKKNVSNIINQAKSKGVEKIIVPGANWDSSKKAVKLAQEYDEIYAAVGIHPHHAKEVTKLTNQQLKIQLEKLAKNKKVVAIGECGLDYYQYQRTKYQDYKIDEKFKKVQEETFIIQISLAKKLNLPLIIHNRNASNNLLKIINNKKLTVTKLKGVFHCFQGNFKLLNWILKNNFFIGITGIITYDKQMQELAKNTPLEKILIETDSPFLTPQPLKSQKPFPNTPENVKIITEWIAKIKGDSFFKIAKQTTKNALQLFKLD